MPITEKDVIIVNAFLMTKKAGTIIHETFKIATQVMGTPYVSVNYNIHFESTLPENCACYQVNYIIQGAQVKGMVIVVEGEGLQAACLAHFTEQRDITYAPINHSRNILN